MRFMMVSNWTTERWGVAYIDLYEHRCLRYIFSKVLMLLLLVQWPIPFVWWWGKNATQWHINHFIMSQINNWWSWCGNESVCCKEEYTRWCSGVLKLPIHTRIRMSMALVISFRDMCRWDFMANIWAAQRKWMVEPARLNINIYKLLRCKFPRCFLLPR